MTSRTSRRVFTPPRWLNAVTTLVLRTPGLQRLAGRSTALAAGVARDAGGRPLADDVAAALDDTVVVAVDLAG